jgi:hypothetical protein
LQASTKEALMPRILARIAVLAALAALALSAHAQTAYPSKPIRILVPFPPAQISDSVARAIGEGLAQALGQPVIVENKPGQAGSIGVAEFAKAAPDGYTLLLGATAAFASNKFLYQNVPYDPLKDFQPITMISTTRLLLMVGAHVPAKNMQELVKIMKDNPTRLSYASSGYGTISHMTMEAFKLACNCGAVHVPYPGIAQSTTAMLGGPRRDDRRGVHRGAAPEGRQDPSNRGPHAHARSIAPGHPDIRGSRLRGVRPHLVDCDVRAGGYAQADRGHAQRGHRQDRAVARIQEEVRRSQHRHKHARGRAEMDQR